jgi:hypothetical protein
LANGFAETSQDVLNAINSALNACGVTIQISPAQIDMSRGQKVSFSATLTNVSIKTVVWNASGASNQIDQNGNFTAGTNPGTFTVSAQSLAFPSLIANATVNIKGLGPVIVSPFNGALVKTGKLTFKATVTGPPGTDQTVTWSVAGGGTIDSSGTFTSNGTIGAFPVTAVSVADPGAIGHADANVVAPPAQIQYNVECFCRKADHKPVLRYSAATALPVVMSVVNAGPGVSSSTLVDPALGVSEIAGLYDFSPPVGTFSSFQVQFTEPIGGATIITDALDGFDKLGDHSAQVFSTGCFNDGVPIVCSF